MGSHRVCTFVFNQTLLSTVPVDLGEQANNDVINGQPISFSNVTLPFDLSQLICPSNGTVTLCIDLSRAGGSNVNFTVTGATQQCTDVPCKGIGYFYMEPLAQCHKAFFKSRNSRLSRILASQIKFQLNLVNWGQLVELDSVQFPFKTNWFTLSLTRLTMFNCLNQLVFHQLVFSWFQLNQV